ncbi:unnamed protein product [Lymnaea stagnalis]|uniref:Uncharacterized protein n=2 Tax=Lymnaea stagnalis TaxID=6523 RepID=A0AAV2IKG8_LYMST
MSVKTFGFGLRAFKKYPELIPLVGIITTACVGCAAFMGYALATKPDVRVVKSRGPAYEDVGPTESRKLIELNRTKYQPIPELVNLRKEIGSYKS